MGRPRNPDSVKTIKGKESATDDAKLPPKKRRWKRGGVVTRKRIRMAQTGKHPVPDSVMRRMLSEASGGKMWWSRSALKLIIEILHAHVHRTLTITNAIMVHGGVKTLTKDHLVFGRSLANEI